MLSYKHLGETVDEKLKWKEDCKGCNVQIIV